MHHGVETTTADSESAFLTRDLPAIAERVLIVGLDGATWDVLDPMIRSGRMPHLQALVERGTSGILESTKPPITPAAWTTFMTGKCPGTHGILDFEKYDVHTNRVTFNSQRSVAHVRTLWDVLGDKGLRVGVVNVPMTYPPRPVNGFMITGFETPSVNVEFTHPKELKEDILRRWPDYTFKTTWQRRVLGGERLLAENLRNFCRSFHQGAEVTKHFGEAHGWDALMVVFKLVDNLQHKTWKYLDPRFNGKHPRRAAMVADCYKELDTALGTLFDYAREKRASVFIVSDHGHGSLEGKVQANLLLKRWGYLHLESPVAQIGTRARYLWSRMNRRGRGPLGHHGQVTQDLAVNFGRTRACVMHAGEYGFLYLNLKGRQPGGIVEPESYERLRDEIGERFLSVRARHPRDGLISVFSDVFKPEEVYGCSRRDNVWLPDLFLKPADGLSVARRIRGRGVVRWLPWRKLEGTHRYEGMFAAAGRGIARGQRARAAIVDSTPMILAMLGIRIPDDMEGRVVKELFDPPLRCETEPAGTSGVASQGEGVYSEADERLLVERLADLGYLD